MLYSSSVQAQDDYLGLDLRKQVEQLKVDAAETPTNAKNVIDRAPVVWAWMNAQSMRGEQFLIDLPLWLSYPISLPDEPVLPLAVRAIDGAIRELQIKEEHPGAIGAFSVDSIGPYEVNSHQTIVQTYTVGSLGLPVGGGLLLAHQLMADYGVPQTKDPAKADYLTITCSNPNASFDEGKFRIPSFIHGVYPGTPLSFTLKGTSLKRGETISITYGDRSGGSPGFLMQSSENDDFMLPIYVDLEGKRNYFTVEWPGIKVVGGDAAGANAVVPSVVAPGEKFELAIRTHDAYYNRAAGKLPKYTVSLDGKHVGAIDSSATGSVRMPGLALNEQGVYRYEIQSEDGSINVLSNPVWVQDDPAYRIYWGETHGHTSYAEGQGTVDNFFRYGREDGLLDFIALSEHDAWMDDWEWSTLVDAVDRFNVPNEYVVFLSFEWTARVQYGGHHNILYRTAPGRNRVPVQTAPSLSDLIFGLKKENNPSDLLVIPHAHMPGDWRQNDPQLGRLVEITSMHGTFEWFGNYYLQHGHQIGFVGASDNHEGRPGFSGDSSTGAFQHFGGLGAVLAPEKTSDAIFDAMRNIDAYATSDAARIILNAKLNNETMGTRVKFSPKREMLSTVMGTSPIDTIDVIKNGDIVETKHYLSAPLESECWVKISFESTSEHGMRDSPRGNRIWNGTIKVANAEISEVKIPGLRNPYHERAQVDPNNPDTIEFHNETRGRSNTILVKLANASSDTGISIDLDRTMEAGITYPIRYRPSAFPKRALSVTLADVDRSGFHDIELQEGRFTDHIGLEIYNPSGALDQEFSYLETKATTHDDYYYLRVTQLDGSRAWSSPWWVGGDPPR
jgi:hypothetical protein